ncbi:hypothetical protein [Lysinibacillus agricola]|uniref:hypothetical protein n=1 Tax=Lysinibacillus agricola TaxID=2590012 RepID=UPI003C22FFF8
MVKKVKRAAKKVVLAGKKAVKKATKYTKAVVKKAKQYTKAAVKKTKNNTKATPKADPKANRKKAGKAAASAASIVQKTKYINLEKSCPAPQKYSVNDGEPVTTLTDLRQVLSTPSTVTPDGLAPIALGANIAYSLVAEDLVTLADPNATPKEHFDAFISSINPVGKAKKGKKAMETFNDLENALEAANDAKKAKDVHYTQKEIEQLGEYAKKLDKGTEKAGQKVSGSNSKVIEELEGPIIDGKRVGSGEKVDKVKPVWGRDEKGKPIIEKEFPHVPKEHGFSDVVDNYSRFSEKFPLVGGDKIERELYQITGSNNGKKGVFEWIVEPNGDLSHRRFIEDGVITGKPNQVPKK